MNVSIIIPTHKPDKTLERALEYLEKQKFKGKKEIIKVEGLGLAESLNYGIKKAKYDIIVSLHQDCVPCSIDWLTKLVEPLKNEEVVASVSKVLLPYMVWESFGIATKMMTAKEARTLTPLMDEKGCAYKKENLVRAGLFDYKTFRTCGEDFDMYFKLKKQGRIAYPNCRIFHFHRTTFRKRLGKEHQYAEGYGTLFRIYKRKMPRWWIALIKTLPLIGALIFILKIDRKVIKYFLLWLFLSIILNFIYCHGFWKGYLNKKQTI
jgi:GT2 family glycosyltransferase